MKSTKLMGRTVQLKAYEDKWQNMCSHVKKKCAKINRLQRKSMGRNDSEIPEFTQVEEEIKDIVGELAIEGIEGGIDMDISDDSI